MALAAKRLLLSFLLNSKNRKWIPVIVLLPFILILSVVMFPAVILGVLTSTPMVEYEDIVNIYNPVIETIEKETKTKLSIFDGKIEGEDLDKIIKSMIQNNTGRTVGNGVEIDIAYLISIDAIIFEQDFSKVTYSHVKEIADLFIYEEIEVEYVYFPPENLNEPGRYETHIYRKFYSQTIEDVLQLLVDINYIKSFEIEDILTMIDFIKVEDFNIGDYEPEIEGTYGWLWPTPSTRITSHFGPRIHPLTKLNSFHYGVDIGAIRSNVAGDPVWAMADGKVEYSKYSRGAGNVILIDHGNGIKTKYMHLYDRRVFNNQEVKKGDLIGLMGNTGNSTGVHLHFEIIYNHNPVNPLAYFNL